MFFLYLGQNQKNLVWLAGAFHFHLIQEKILNYLFHKNKHNVFDIF